MPDPAPDFLLAKQPWERLSLRSAELVERERANASEEIIKAISESVPAYRRPLKGQFGDAVRSGVEQSLLLFAAMIRDPNTALREKGRRVYVALGRGELEAGRSIGALLAAYRLGAQIAWRHVAEAGLREGLDQRESNLLAEAIFAYIDELSAESATGYAEAQAARAGELDARRAELIDLVTRGSLASDPVALERSANAANWVVPREVAVLTWSAQLGREPAARLPIDSIVRGDEDEYVALIPEPRDPARRAQLISGFASIPSGLGSPVRVFEAGVSLAHSRTIRAVGAERGIAGIVLADEHRSDLVARADKVLAAEILRDRLAALDDETAGSRARLTDTLREWLRHDGNIAQSAEALHVHAQTLRYRLARLRELLGDVLDDSEWRYEVEFALRSQTPSS